MRTLSVALLLASTTACGTYSLVRPADTLPAGRVELAAGLAASQLGEVNTIVHGAVGITDDVEVFGHNEFLNTFGEVRYGILHSDDRRPRPGSWPRFRPRDHPGVGDRRRARLRQRRRRRRRGRQRHDRQALGLDRAGGRQPHLRPDRNAFLMSSTRAQARVGVSRSFGLLVEVGGTVHAPTDALDASLFIGEGSLGLWVGF
jgi:hypothetical protein